MPKNSKTWYRKEAVAPISGEADRAGFRGGGRVMTVWGGKQWTGPGGGVSGRLPTLGHATLHPVRARAGRCGVSCRRVRGAFGVRCGAGGAGGGGVRLARRKPRPLKSWTYHPRIWLSGICCAGYPVACARYGTLNPVQIAPPAGLVNELEMGPAPVSRAAARQREIPAASSGRPRRGWGRRCRLRAAAARAAGTARRG